MVVSFQRGQKRGTSDTDLFRHQGRVAVPPLRSWLLAHQDHLRGARLALVASCQISSPARIQAKYDSEFGPLAALAVVHQKLSEPGDGDSFVQAIEGATEMLSPDEALAVVRLCVKRHPSLRDFAASPSYRFYGISAQRHSLVSRFQHVEDLLLG